MAGRDDVCSVRGTVFTHETHLARALAAEFRAAPERTVAVFEAVLGRRLTPLASLTVESSAWGCPDVLLDFGGTTVRVEPTLEDRAGCEAVCRPLAPADHHVLVVRGSARAAEEVAACCGGPQFVGWTELLEFFPGSRVHVDDVEAAHASHLALVAAVREAEASRPEEDLGAEWVLQARGGACCESPGIDVAGPALRGDARLRLQVEADTDGDPPRFHATIGTVVSAAEMDDAATEAPAWIGRARLIGEFLERELMSGPFRVSTVPAGANRGSGAGTKVALAERFGLPLRWAHGPADAYVGPETEPFPADRLDDFLTEMKRVLPPLQAALVAADRG